MALSSIIVFALCGLGIFFLILAAFRKHMPDQGVYVYLMFFSSIAAFITMKMVDWHIPYSSTVGIVLGCILITVFIIKLIIQRK